jgi:hypothetical protein
LLPALKEIPVGEVNAKLHRHLSRCVSAQINHSVYRGGALTLRNKDHRGAQAKGLARKRPYYRVDIVAGDIPL